MAENALAPEQKLPKAPPVLPDDEVLYELADLFRVFGDSTRIKILYALHDDELCVQDIANAVQLSQSAVSHQLRVLKDSKLVRFRRDGKTIYYATRTSLTFKGRRNLLSLTSPEWLALIGKAHPEHQLWGKVKARENSCYLLEKEDDEFLYVKDLCSEDEGEFKKIGRASCRERV